MNTNSGRLYEGLGDDVVRALDTGHGEEIRRALFFERRTADERAALTDALAGDKIVPVSPMVAQKIKLGERELERRAKRRKQAKASRKRNR